MNYGPIARMLLNTIGSMLFMAGVLDAGQADTLAANKDAILIATGVVGILAQYGGWVFAKLRGWAT